MIYKLVKNIITGKEDLVFRVLENGAIESCSTQHEASLKRVDEGNTPLPADQ